MYILDIEMPGMDGLRTAREIRTRDSKALIVFLTGYTKYMPDVFEVVTFDFIPKPITEERLRLLFVKAETYLNMTNQSFSFSYRRSRYSLKFDEILYLEKKVTEELIDGHYVPVGEDVLKTKSSFRTLPLIPVVEELLLEEKEKQETFRMLFKKSYCMDYLDYICLDEMDKLMRPNYVTEHFAWILNKYELKKIRFHDLRHSCASLLLANGISMKQIQIWLGHSTFATTADIYLHLDYSAQVESGQVMNNMYM